jgi:hypothetical protein
LHLFDGGLREYWPYRFEVNNVTRTRQTRKL